jgi:hypothetical protein
MMGDDGIPHRRHHFFIQSIFEFLSVTEIVQQF